MSTPQVWCFLFKEQMKSTSQTHLGCNLLPKKRLGTSHIYDESCFLRFGFCPEGSKSTQKGVTENALVVGPILHPKGLRKMLEDMEKDFESGQEADKLGGGGSKSGGSLASGTLGLEWKRSKLLCVIGRRQRWSTRFDGVGRGVVWF
ncbi:hypothetical protein F2Q68_00039872 [Brassica cretica]|uniref:Uncharacterized protein n=1 Tax=Brassica cretica TaxID=69181 RepID=A0A8S9MCN3_BRACR|nr:hypothetical protein F2Q68_00039872 [Brassica cretica]